MTINKQVCRKKFLVIDDQDILEINNLTRKVNQAIKHPEPVLKLDAPWERDMTGCCQSYNVIFDEEDNLFKMWYTTTKPDRGAPGGQQGILAYAISRNGVNWEKPTLNLVEVGGSTENNVILGQRGAYCIIHDPSDVRARRFKMIFWLHDPYWGTKYADWSHFHCPLSLAYSADGIIWDRPVHVNPVLRGSADGAIGFYYDTDRRKYVLLTRRVPNLPRDVSQYESYDLVNWEDLGRVLVPGDKYDPPELFNYQAMTAFRYDNLYLGLLVTHYSLPGAESYEVFHRPPDGYPGSERFGQLEVQLAYTYDGVTWRRPVDRSPVIPNGKSGSPDAGMIFVWGSHTVRRGGETLIYYNAAPTRHNAWFGGHGGSQLSEAEKEKLGKSSCMLAKMPEDHWVSLDAGQQEGWFLTKPWHMGSQLLVNADAQGGSIEVELITPYGQVVEGCSRAECIPITGNGKDQEIKWRSGRCGWDFLEKHKGGMLAKFYLKNAKLYSYTTVEPDKDGAVGRHWANARWLEHIKHRSDNWGRNSNAPATGLPPHREEN